MRLGKPKHVKVYDLKQILLAEFYTFKEASIFLNINLSTVKKACQKNHILNKKYLIKSEDSKFIGYVRGQRGENHNKLLKLNNKKRCQIKYLSKDLEKLSIEMNTKIALHIFNVKSSKNLSDNYVKKALEKHIGISYSLCTPKLIEIKRKDLEIKRKLKIRNYE